MRPKPFAFILLLGTALPWSAGAIGQTPWIDAGQQAMIMHQGDLLEQQTAPNNSDTEDNRASSRQKPDTANLTCATSRDREKLRPEYERRLRTDGREAADTWLRQEAAALGRQAGARAKAGEQC